MAKAINIKLAWLSFFLNIEKRTLSPNNFVTIGVINSMETDGKKASFNLTANSQDADRFIEVGLTEDIYVRKGGISKVRYIILTKLHKDMRADFLFSTQKKDEKNMFSAKVEKIRYDVDLGRLEVDLYDIGLEGAE